MLEVIGYYIVCFVIELKYYCNLIVTKKIKKTFDICKKML